MTTSGTLGLTRINTSRLLEKAIRRCGLNPASLTPETTQTAQEDLFMLLLSLSNKGLNLWTVDKQILSLVPNQATYLLPIGTLDILNLMFSTPALVTDAILTTPINTKTAVTFPEPQQRLSRFGIKFLDSVTKVVVTSYESDHVTAKQSQTFQVINGVMLPNQLYWFDIDPAMVGDYLELVYTTVLDPLTLGAEIMSDLYLDQAPSGIAVSPFNRDDYTNQPRKTFTSSTVTNYWFEKLVDPKITLWPVPSDETRCLELWRYRQVQDVGSLTEEIEIPSRWYEAITWHLALRLAFELPGIDSARISMLQQMVQGMTIEVESGETDGSPTYFAPNIGVYTR